MTLYIKMRGELDSIPIRGEFKDTIAEMQLMGAGGKTFVVASTPDGDPLAISLSNIISIREIDNAF